MVGQTPEVSAVIPVYRTAESLRAFHTRLRNALRGYRLCEIIYVNDASPDDSATILSDLALHDPHVTLVSLERNVGQNRAVLAGLARAQGRRVVIMDADLQDPPEAVPELLERLQEGSAAFAGRQGRYESSPRLITSRLFKGALHYLCGIPADAGLFVALTRETVDRLLMIRPPGPSVVAMLACTAAPATSIPVVRSVRPYGNSAYSTWARLKIGGLAIAWVLAYKWRHRHADAELSESQTGIPQ